MDSFSFLAGNRGPIPVILILIAKIKTARVGISDDKGGFVHCITPVLLPDRFLQDDLWPVPIDKLKFLATGSDSSAAVFPDSTVSLAKVRHGHTAHRVGIGNSRVLPV